LTSSRFSSARDTLPWAALLALAMTGFTAILTETLPAGLLPLMAQDLGVSQALAGQTVTAYAVGSLIAAIPLTLWTQGWRRKPTLLCAIIGFLVFNTLTAVSQNYGLTLAARFLAGMAAGLGWGIVSGYARRMVVPSLQGRALAIAMAGTPLALSFGLPAGAWLGEAVGWRTAFLSMSAMTVALIAWVLCFVPDFPGQAAHQRLSIVEVFGRPGVRTVLVTLLGWITAHNIVYTYVAPFAALSGLGQQLGPLLLGFGLAALAGIWITGMLVDRALRPLVLGSLVLFAGVTLLLALWSSSAAVTIVAVLAWGLSFGGAATQLQTALADAAGDGVDLANAMLTTTWNSAIAAGGIAGGLLLEHLGARSLAWTAFLLTAFTLALAHSARRYGFRPGHRATLAPTTTVKGTA
jgi:predicted MFS family arabinose efflux permease